MLDYDDDEESVVLDIEESEEETVSEPDDIEDHDFEDSCGYFLVKLLKGNTTGRKLKQKLFKAGLFSGICGFSIVVITGYEQRAYGGLSYFKSTEHGETLINLQFWVAILSIFLAVIIAAMIKYYASLCTNRQLLQNALMIVMGLQMLLFIMTLWCTCVLFLTFRGVDWESSAQPVQLLLSYVFTIIFIVPYLISLPHYCMEISHYSAEIDANGVILEPDMDENTIDLSHLTMDEILQKIIAVPIYIVMQIGIIYQMIAAFISSLLKDCFEKEEGPPEVTLSDEELQRREEEKKQRSSQPSVLQSLKDAALSFFAASSTAGRRVNPVPAQDEESGEEDLPPAPTIPPRPIPQPPKEQPLEKIKDEEKKNDEELVMSPTMSVHQFKALWSALGTAGSFQCKLRTPPSSHAVMEHLRRQNFHVVFAATPSPGENEIGICNIREAGNEPWFMARMLYTSSTFSAVMKCQDLDVVESHVRRFALAKVLKIDTSK